MSRGNWEHILNLYVSTHLLFQAIAKLGKRDAEVSNALKASDLHQQYLFFKSSLE